MNSAQQAQQIEPTIPPLFPAKVAIPAERAKQMRLVTRAQALVDQAMADPSALIAWPAPISELLSKLTDKQRQFAIKTGGGMPAVHAYRAAYDVSEGRPDIELYPDISHLNNHPKISQAVLMLRDWLGQKWLLEAIEVKDWGVAKLYEEASWAGKASDRLKATELLLKMHGHLVDKKEITHRDASEIDEQSALFKSIMGDLSLNTVIDAEYVVANQQLSGPTLGLTCPHCPHCQAVGAAAFEDGAGI